MGPAPAGSEHPERPDRFTLAPVTATVPATSANLGPGYDCLGLALSLRDTLVGTVLESGLEITVEGEGAAIVPRDERHLVVRAMRRAFAAMSLQPPGLRLECHNRIPHSRGLGSSSAAIVGGLVLARALVEAGEDLLSDHDLLALATELEGHPDNVASALLGGLVVSGQSPEQVWASRVRIDPRISAVALVPPHGVRTEVARGLLPDEVSHADAAANTGRAALLVAALAGAPEHLLRATEDFLHQDYREPAMPESLALVRRLRADGLAAFVSGAGPTVLVLGFAKTTAEGPGTDLRAAVAEAPTGWLARHLEVDHAGAGT